MSFFTRSTCSASELGVGTLQNAQRPTFPLPLASSHIASIQPLQITLPQHDLKVVWPVSNGNGRKQIGQSSRGGCSLNSSLSCSSATATLFLHTFLCFDQCFFLHAALQYLTIWHLLHVLRLPPSLPHAAQFVVEVPVDAMVHVKIRNILFVVVDCYLLPKDHVSIKIYQWHIGISSAQHNCVIHSSPTIVYRVGGRVELIRIVHHCTVRIIEIGQKDWLES